MSSSSSGFGEVARKRRSTVMASSPLPASIRRFACFSVGWFAGLAGPVSA